MISHDKMIAKEKTRLPLVSVGLPVYNGGFTIANVLDMLLKQTWPNLEIYISDNASSDETSDICLKYASLDSRISYHKNKTNHGIIENFRKTCLASRGDYFFWAAADDRWEPTFVEKLVAAMEQYPEAGVSLCALKRQYASGEDVDVLRFTQRKSKGYFASVHRVLNLLHPSTARRKRKYNVFVCGIFRGDLIRDVISEYSFIPGERPLVGCILIDNDLLFLDDILMTKTLHKKSFDKRYIEDDYKKNKMRLGRLGYYLHSFRFLLSSRIVSFRSKCIVLPLAIIDIVGYLLYDKIKRVIMDNIPDKIANKIRSIYYNRNSGRL